MPKVLIAPMTLAKSGGDYVQVFRDAGLELTFPAKPMQLSEDELLETLKGVSAAIAGSEPYTRRVLAANPQLRVIARAGVGYDAVDLAAATEYGMAVTIAPNTNQDAVAEHTFALILALAKEVIPQHLEFGKGGWPRRATLPLRGRALGIAGLGRIGKAVATRGAAFGMKLLAYEPYPDQAFVAQYGVKLLPFDQLLAESDYLTLHLPLTPESKHLMNRRTLGLMKPTAFLINTARGGLVCETDLCAALREKRLAGAGLDVFEEEPPSCVNAVCGFANVVTTPHAAGVDTQSRDDMAVSSAQAIVDLMQGRWPAEKVVNADVRAKFRW